MEPDETRRHEQPESIRRHLITLSESAELPFQSDIELKRKTVTDMCFYQPCPQLKRRKRRQRRNLLRRLFIRIGGKKTDPV